MDASRQPSCIVEMKDDDKLSFLDSYREGSVTFQSMFEQSNQQTAHKEVWCKKFSVYLYWNLDTMVTFELLEVTCLCSDPVIY